MYNNSKIKKETRNSLDNIFKKFSVNIDVNFEYDEEQQDYADSDDDTLDDMETSMDLELPCNDFILCIDLFYLI